MNPTGKMADFLRQVTTADSIHIFNGVTDFTGDESLDFLDTFIRIHTTAIS